MKRTNRLILVVGILLAAVAFVAIIFLFNNQGGGGGGGNLPQGSVVVASRDIKLGDTIQERDVTTNSIPLSQEQPDQFRNPGEVIGQVARTDIAKGANLNQAMFSGTGAPSIAKDLPSGMVAMAVRVDAATGVGTLILPGDRVDVVMTLEITPVSVTPGQEGAPPAVAAQDALKTPSSKVLLQNVEVRAVLGATASGTADTATAGGGTVPDLAAATQVVILGMTTQQAEVLEYVTQKAQVKAMASTAAPGLNITLLLRSPKDKDAPAVETTGIVLETLIKEYGVLPPVVLEASLPPTK